MTTMAALLSGVPLMLESGAGSELRKPLGFAMVGGLALSQVLTLYTTPVIYLYLDRLQHWLAPRRASRVPKIAAILEGSEAESADYGRRATGGRGFAVARSVAETPPHANLSAPTRGGRGPDTGRQGVTIRSRQRHPSRKSLQAASVSGDADRPAEPADAVAHRGDPAAGGAGRAAPAACRPGRLRGVQRRGDHRLLRRQAGPHAPPAIRPRPHARPDRRQTAGRRRADDAGGPGTAVRGGPVPRHRHHAARDPGQRAARIPRRSPHRPAGDPARQMEDRLPDGRARHAAGRRLVGAVAAPVVHPGQRHRRDHAVGRRRADAVDRLGLPDRRVAPRLRLRAPLLACRSGKFPDHQGAWHRRLVRQRQDHPADRADPAAARRVA